MAQLHLSQVIHIASIVQLEVVEEPPRKHIDISAPQLTELPKNITLIPLEKLNRSAIEIVDPALQEPKTLKEYAKANSTNTLFTKPAPGTTF